MAKKSTNPLDYMLHGPGSKPTAQEYEKFEELIDEEAAELVGKDRESVMRRIEELENGKDEAKYVKNLRFQIKTRLLNEIAKRSRAAERPNEDGSGRHEGHGH
jgi:hypothetical protein